MIDDIIEANKDRLLCSNRTLYYMYSELRDYVRNPENVNNSDYMNRLLTYDKFRFELIKRGK